MLIFADAGFSLPLFADIAIFADIISLMLLRRFSFNILIWLRIFGCRH